MSSCFPAAQSSMAGSILLNFNDASQPAWRVLQLLSPAKSFQATLLAPTTSVLLDSQPDLIPSLLGFSNSCLPCRDGASSDGSTGKPGLETGSADDDTTGSELYWADRPHWPWQTYKEDLAVSRAWAWVVGGFSKQAHMGTRSRRVAPTGHPCIMADIGLW